MRIISSFILLWILAGSAMAQNLVLVNGAVMDGTGKARTPANIRIRDGKVSDVGPFKPAADETLLDIKGLIAAPGFVDFQNLSPSAIEKDPAAAALVTQG